MSDRGMKKWAPYASLIEQKGTMQRMKQQRGKAAKPLLSNEAAEELNRNLLESIGKDVIIDYFEKGERKTIKTVVIRLNLDEKMVKTQDGNLPFSSLLKVEIR
jgi:hypothetical protein